MPKEKDSTLAELLDSEDIPHYFDEKGRVIPDFDRMTKKQRERYACIYGAQSAIKHTIRERREEKPSNDSDEERTSREYGSEREYA